jgi:hypothetical protein
MLCSHELQVLLDKRLHISEGPTVADLKSARLSARSARPHEPAWVEDVVARRKAELEELDYFKATDEQACEQLCLVQHFQDKLALESSHVQELSKKLEEQQLGREMDAAHALAQRHLLQGEYEEYGARKHDPTEMEIEFREEYAMYQVRSHSLKQWQTEFSTECAEFRTRNQGLIESQSRLQDECKAYAAHCCSLVDMQDKLRTELDEYRERNLSLARWQGRFQQECEEFGARNRDLREWKTKFAEESEECVARNRDLARQQTSFADECAEFKTRNRSLTEWQSRFADEYTEYKALNRSLAKLHQKVPASTSQDADNQVSSAECLLRQALACRSVPPEDVRMAIGRMEVLLQESKLEMAARALSEQREAALQQSIAGENAMPALIDGRESLPRDRRGCLKVVVPEKHVQEEVVRITGSAASVLEDQEHCKDPASVASSAKHLSAATSMEAIETHLPDFEMLTPIAPPISKGADACSTVKLGMQPPSLTMEAAALSFPTVAAVLTPRMIVKRRLPSTPSEPA